MVASLVARLTAPGVRWIDQHDQDKQMTPQDILIVAPYNAQVSRLAERLGTTGVRVGTVDKFQGQEAPVVIYSTATSPPEDAPRGMEFLYNPNRLNVAHHVRDAPQFSLLARVSSNRSAEHPGK